MKVSDFKLLVTLPELYDYSIFEDGDNRMMVIGKNHQTVIGFRIINDELRPIKFQVEPKEGEYR